MIASAYNLAPDALWFPPLIETLIAVSIVYMALENIVGGSTVQRRWIIAFGFGLVHGFGFSFALRETLQFAGSHLLTSLLSFNVGVELGQLLVLGVLIPALELLFRFVVAERMGTIILSALVAHTGWHWMTERFDRFAAVSFCMACVRCRMAGSGPVDSDVGLDNRRAGVGREGSGVALQSREEQAGSPGRRIILYPVTLSTYVGDRVTGLATGALAGKLHQRPSGSPRRGNAD